MAISKARATWKGQLTKGGEGTMTADSGVFDTGFNLPKRAGEEAGTTPEEFIAAAHAGCFSMQLSALLGGEGHDPSVETEVDVTLNKDDSGFFIERIQIATIGRMEGIDEASFQRLAEQAKETCPVSKALKAVGDIQLTARLQN